MKKISKLIVLLLIISFIVPHQVNAATTVPKKVITAMNKAIDENGRVIVIDIQGERMYLFKNKKLKDSFRCVCSDYLNPNECYFLIRNKDTDLRKYKEDGKTYEYGVYIDSYKKPMKYTIRIHSYAKAKGKTYKSSKHNPFGFAICTEKAKLIWKYYGDGTAIMSC